MGAATGSAVRYYYTIEDAGEIAATTPAFTAIRFKSTSLGVNTAQVGSDEINQNRQRPVDAQGTYSTQGEISGELSHTTYSELLEIAMQSAFSTNTLKVGSTIQTIAILERHTDTGEDYIFRGCRVNTVAVSASVDQRVGITFGVIGTEAEEYTVPGDAVLGSATTTKPMVSTAGSVTEGGAELAYATAYDFTLSNGMNPIFVLGQRSAYDVANGVLTATGTLSAYMPNGTLYAKFLNETATVLVFQLSDGTNTLTFTFPAVIYTQADGGVSGMGEIVRQYTFSAGYDSTAATTVTIVRSA